MAAWEEFTLTLEDVRRLSMLPMLGECDGSRLGGGWTEAEVPDVCHDYFEDVLEFCPMVNFEATRKTTLAITNSSKEEALAPMM